MADHTGGPAGPHPGRSIAISFLGDPNSVHVRRFATYFAARGHRVTLLVPNDLELRAGFSADIAIVRFRGQSGWRVPQLGLLATGWSARRAVARSRPDVLQVHYLTVNGFRAWSSGFHPCVVTVWGNDVLIDPRRSRRARILARLSLRSADLVTGLTKHLVDAAIEFGAKPERTRVLHFGVDTALFSPGPDPTGLRARLGLTGRRVLFSPRIIDRLYRHEVIIEALAALPQDVTLVMTRYFANAEVQAELERLIADLGLTERVVIAPETPYSDRPDFYRLADAVVSVPETDGGPVSLIEALAVGRPIVCSDLPPVREWLEEIDPAGLVPVGDVAATAAAIRTALDTEPAERAEISRLGREAVLQRADQSRTMAELERLYLELAAGGSPNR